MSVITQGNFTLVETSSSMIEDFAWEVLIGLSMYPKQLPCRYLYDQAGSELFEQICSLPEYYLTQAERSIIMQNADEIAASMPQGAELVELGSGSCSKTGLLIEALIRRSGGLRFIPIDISTSMLKESAARLMEEYPALDIHAIAGDYHQGLLRVADEPAMPRMIAWLGSSIGNFAPREAASFLRDIRSSVSDDHRLLIGIDLLKDVAILERAYNDYAGVTAAFNKNVLKRINRELNGDFDIDYFTHRAIFDSRFNRVEMHLVSNRQQRVKIDHSMLHIEFEEGETIHTEDSYKYPAAKIADLAIASGFSIERQWLDADRMFSLNLFAPNEASE